jgi:hypothetical protein
MTDFEKAKEAFNNKEYEKTISILEDILSDKNDKIETHLYSDILCYLGDSKLELYRARNKKSLIYSALIDYSTAANNLLANDINNLDFLKTRIKSCYLLI